MADILQSLFGQIVQRFKDMGDGTFAKVVATVSSNSGAAADQVQGNVASGAVDAGNPVKVGGQFNSTQATFADGQRAHFYTTPRGELGAAMVGAAAAAADGTSNTLNYTYGSGALALAGRPLAGAGFVSNGTSWDRDTKANGTSRLASSAATTNATSAKAAAGTAHAIEAYNASAAVKYLKLYNKASAPVVGTDTPVRTIALKAGDRTSITFPRGLYFSTGIAWALTGAATDSDTTALAAGDVVGLNIDYS